MFLGDQEIEGLTDKIIPRRLGPKRATKIRRLFNLTKDDDVRKYVIRRTIPAKEGKIFHIKAYQMFSIIGESDPLDAWFGKSGNSF